MPQQNSIFLASQICNVLRQIATELPFEPAQVRSIFLQTAAEAESGDKSWLEEEYSCFEQQGFKPERYSLSGKSAAQVRKDLGSADLIHVSGGNTFYLLLQAQRCEFAPFIRERVEAGAYYLGCSAGSVIAGPSVLPARRIHQPQVEQELQGYDGFSLVDLVCLPHWGNPRYRELYLERRLEHCFSEDYKIILLTDQQYLRSDGRSFQIASSSVKSDS